MNRYLSRNYKGVSSAGNKAKTDIEQIMSAAGFRNAGFRQTTFTNSLLAFLATLAGVLKAPFSLHGSDNLVLQYPLKKYFSLVCRLAHLRKAKVIVIIHDLGSFRRKKLTVAQEIKRLSHADYIIAHNQAMKTWLEENGCRVKIGTLGIFDYLSAAPVPAPAPVASPFRVLYAGGLSYRKNTFLYEVGAYIRSYSFYLYGRGFEMENACGKEHFHYMGFVPSDRLIAEAQGDFGLVWDGTSIHACSGDFGEYLRYNNPHKTSLYLRCGLPVIIWRQAALAPFVEENRIGLCVDSLDELEQKLQALTAEEYRCIRQNACRVGQKIAEGYFVTQALKVAEAYLAEKQNR